MRSLGISNVPFTETLSSNTDSSSEKVHNSSSNETLDNPNQNFTNRRSPFSQGSPLKDYSNNGSPESYTSQGSPENYLNTSDSSDQSQSNVQAVSGEVISVQQNSHAPNVQQNYQNLNQNITSVSSQFTSNIHHGNLIQSGTNTTATVPANYSNQLGNPRQLQSIPQTFSSQPTTNEQIPRINQSFVNQPSQTFNTNFPLETSGDPPSFLTSSYDESFLSGQSFTGNFQPYESQHDHQNKLCRRTSCNQDFNTFSSCGYNTDILFGPSFGQGMNMGIQHNFQSFSNDNNNENGNVGTFASVNMSNTNYGNQQQNYQQNFGLGSTNISQQSLLQNSSLNVPFQSYTSGPPPPVTQPLSTSDSPQRARPSKQPDLQINTNTPLDQISVLSKQFSRSQVEDPCPPALALTPRGTGAGYGVGMDLDSLIMDSQDIDLVRSEPSPLSSSLLTDWMEVTGDLNIDMEALEQELSLQSPMALSYSDLSMYPS